MLQTILIIILTTVVDLILIFIFNRIAYMQSVGGLIKRKTYIQIYPDGRWDSWSYIIYAQGTKHPFFMWHRSRDKFDTYDKALIHAKQKLTEL